MLALLRESQAPGARKLRLFACACWRAVWHLLTDRERVAVEVAERVADGLAGEAALEAALCAADTQGSGRHPYWLVRGLGAPDPQPGSGFTGPPDVGDLVRATRSAAYWSGPPGYDAASIRARYEARGPVDDRLAHLLRCLIGPAPRAGAAQPAWLAWEGGTIRRLAQGAYDERALPSGDLDCAQLAVLADALEEAGCADDNVLRHLRGPGPHVRGCRAVDLLLGKA